jgi:hypothetical protein
MEEKAFALIEKLGAVIAQSGTVMVEEYTRWTFVDGIAWSLFGLALIFAAVRLGVFVFGIEDMDPIGKGFLIAGCIFMAIIGGVATAGNMGDIFAPKGKAIHYLIKDIRGK